MTRLLGLGFCLSFFACLRVSAPDAAPDPKPNVVRSALAAGGAIATKRDFGGGRVHWYGCGAAFVQGKTGPLLLTARHCLHPRIEQSPVLCLHPDTTEIKQIMPAELDGAVGQRECSIVDESAEADLALLEPKYSVPPSVVPLNLGDGPIERGQRVFGVASPNTALNTWFEGFINGRVNYLNLQMPEGFEQKEMFGYTSPVAGGASGSMVLNDAGELIGITQAALHGTNTGIATATSRILEVFGEHLVAGAKKP